MSVRNQGRLYMLNRSVHRGRAIESTPPEVVRKALSNSVRPKHCKDVSRQYASAEHPLASAGRGVKSLVTKAVPPSRKIAVIAVAAATTAIVIPGIVWLVLRAQFPKGESYTL